MKKLIAVKLLCITLAIILVGMLITIISLPGYAARGTKNASTGGFSVSPDEISVEIPQEETATVYLTITRETDGAPGICDGNFVITRTQPIFEKLFEYNYYASKEDTNIGSIDLFMSSQANQLPDQLGEEQPLNNGETGLTTFTSANEADFDQVVSNITNGVNDQVGFGYTLYSTGGFWTGTGGVGGFESSIFQQDPDFAGYTIEEIQRDVKVLSITSSDYTFDVDWSVWGYVSPATWLQYEPTSGMLDIGYSQLVTITLDAQGYEPGEYQTDLIFDPGIGCGQPLNIPITMTVLAPCYAVVGVNLSQITSGPIYPGDSVDFSTTLDPSDATPPFTYSVDGGSEISTDTMPITFDKVFHSSGENSVEVSVRNCEMTSEQAIDSDLNVWLDFRVFLATIIK